jgi:hypothetical protein
MIGYRYVKNNTLMGMSPRAVPQRVSDAIDAFVQVRDMVAWENPNNFFCVTRVEALDGEFYDHTDDMNYPVCYFSTECTRSYWATSHCGNLVLNGVPEEVAKSRTNAAGGWSFKGGSMLHYLDSHIIGLCVERANDPNFTSVDQFTILDCHPNLTTIAGYLIPDNNGVLGLPPPSRPKRMASNDGRTPAFLAQLQLFWPVIRQANDPVAIPAGANYFFIERMATRFFEHVAANNINLDQTWGQAIAAFGWRFQGAVRPILKARGKFFNFAIRSKLLNFHDFTGGNLGPVPADAMQTILLFENHPNHQNPPRLLENVNVSNTVNMPTLRIRERNRKRRRINKVVQVQGEVHRVHELSNAQAVLYMQTQTPDPAAWQHAATQP